MKNKLQKSTDEELNYIPYTEIQDLGLAVALMSSGCEISSVNTENPRTVKFIFTWDNKAQKVEREYLADTLSVKARTFFDNMRALKNQLHR